MTSSTNRRYTFHFVCCGRRYDYKTVWERNQARKTHDKTLKHKIREAIADSWVRHMKFEQKRIKIFEDAVKEYAQ